MANHGFQALVNLAALALRGQSTASLPTDNIGVGNIMRGFEIFVEHAKLVADFDNLPE